MVYSAAGSVKKKRRKSGSAFALTVLAVTRLLHLDHLPAYKKASQPRHDVFAFDGRCRVCSSASCVIALLGGGRCK